MVSIVNDSIMDQKPVRIYVRRETQRLRYIAGIILGDIMGLNWDIVTDRRKLGKQYVINYSDEEIPGSFSIIPASILFENGIIEKEITVFRWKDMPVFFPATEGSDLPFDIFAASFYLITRYEEYCNFEPDEFGRFSASSSLAFKNGFLDVPVIDLWTKEFTRQLIRKFRSLVFRRNEFSSIVTFDTDEPFEYLGKSIFRSLGGLLRDLTVSEKQASRRYQTVAGKRPDPFEVFGYISDCLEKYGSDSRFFFPTGDRTKFDHNPSWKNEEYRTLILRLAGKFKYGIHPSFKAAEDPVPLQKEVERLRTITGNNIIRNRFHYIRLKFPDSYYNLIRNDITEDYSMGYPDEPGFRAGIARPYYFYDPMDDVETRLKVVPFQVMDVTLYRYKKLDPIASDELINKMINETRKAGGVFVSIWHNTSLLDNKECKPWRELFETMLQAQR